MIAISENGEEKGREEMSLERERGEIQAEGEEEERRKEENG